MSAVEPTGWWEVDNLTHAFQLFLQCLNAVVVLAVTHVVEYIVVHLLQLEVLDHEAVDCCRPLSGVVRASLSVLVRSH